MIFKLRPLFTSISFKLFFTILLTCLIVTLAMGLAIRYSFESGFNNYLEEREQQRLDGMVIALANEYIESDGWDGAEKKRWSRLLRFSNDRSHRVHSILRLSLLDKDGHHVAGIKSHGLDKQQKIPILVDGNTVGWLLSSSRLPQTISDEIDRQFQDRQLYATWTIVGISVLLAILASLFLARYLVVPIKLLARATQKLAGGDFDVNVKPKSNDELADLAINFNKLAYSLKRNQQLRHELMAEISHELRTPLSILRGEIEAMQDGLKPIDEASLSSLLHEVKQLNHLIDDLYELSLADAGALNYNMSRLNLSELLQSQLDLLKDRFARNGLTINSQIQESLYIQADTLRFTQLINNLLENSLRYTNAPGLVELVLSKENNNICLTIDDSEPGVADSLLTNLFDRFYRVEQSRNRQFGGAGLGLAIVKQIVLAHGGQISVDHSKLNGIRIKLILPISKV